MVGCHTEARNSTNDITSNSLDNYVKFSPNIYADHSKK